MKRKILSLVLVISMFASLFAAMTVAAEDETVTAITISEAAVSKGTGTETVEIPLVIGNNTGVLGVELHIKYAEGLALTDVTRGDALSILSFTKPGDFNANPMKLMWDGEADADTQNGTIATLTFAVPSNAEGEYPIEVIKSIIIDEDMKDVETIFNNGKITVNGGHKHIFDGKWEEYNNDSHIRQCLECEYKETESHIWDDGIVTKEPTDDEFGVRTYTCTVCGYAKEETFKEITGQTIKVSTVTVPYGTNTVDVPIVINNNAGVLGLQFQIEYAEDLTLTEVTRGDALSLLAFTKPGDFNANPVKLMWDGEADADAQNGTIATLTFAVPGNTAGTYAIEISNAVIIDGDMKIIATELISGEISVSNVHIHEWDDGEQTLAPTCTQTGVKTYMCVKCGETKTEEIPAKGHAYGDFATGGADTHSKKCSRCGDVITEDHGWDAGKLVSNATHTKDGSKLYTCTVCKATKTEVINATGHNYGEWEADYGADTHSKYCDCNEEGNVITEAHEWDDGVISKEPTSTQVGIKTYICIVCGSTKTEEIPVLKPEEPVVTGTTVSVGNVTAAQGTGTKVIEVPIYIAQNAGVLGMTLKVKYDDALTLTGVAKGDALPTLAFTKPGDLSANPANILWDGDSSADATNGIIAKLTFTVPTDTVRDYAIEIIQSLTVDENLDPIEVAIKNGKISVSKAHEHEYGDWTADGDNHKKVCSCGDVITELHVWDEGVVTKEPAYPQKGEETYTCAVCGAKKTEVMDWVYNPGDPTDDGEIDTRDIISIRRHIAGGYNVEINLAGADADKSGAIDSRDIILVRRYLAGGYGVVLK